MQGSIASLADETQNVGLVDKDMPEVISRGKSFFKGAFASNTSSVQLTRKVTYVRSKSTPLPDVGHKRKLTRQSLNDKLQREIWFTCSN
ncbi:hypothetical protein L9F63_016230 [Diploptera punctata]|uniref:Uncharacterized protein n=1 Tax=Diploptera punctata TaxID=6984 RepID=A0AAD8EI35_DIPPU|nr:hypothetical protein L9F63_016230 [Diploptera punctata]